MKEEKYKIICVKCNHLIVDEPYSRKPNGNTCCVCMGWSKEHGPWNNLATASYDNQIK